MDAQDITVLHNYGKAQFLPGGLPGRLSPRVADFEITFQQIKEMRFLSEQSVLEDVCRPTRCWLEITLQRILNIWAAFPLDQFGWLRTIFEPQIEIGSSVG